MTFQKGTRCDLRDAHVPTCKYVFPLKYLVGSFISRIIESGGDGIMMLSHFYKTSICSTFFIFFTICLVWTCSKKTIVLLNRLYTRTVNRDYTTLPYETIQPRYHLFLSVRSSSGGNASSDLHFSWKRTNNHDT